MEDSVLSRNKKDKTSQSKFIQRVFDRLVPYPRPFKYEEEIILNVENYPEQNIRHVAKSYVLCDDGGAAIVMRNPNDLQRAMLMITVKYLNGDVREQF